MNNPTEIMLNTGCMMQAIPINTISAASTSTASQTAERTSLGNV